MEKDNSRTWSNSSRNVQGETASLNFRNETGGAMVIKDLEEPIEIWVRRTEDQADFSTIPTLVNVTTPNYDEMIIHIIGKRLSCLSGASFWICSEKERWQ